jgi:hypothetical protein
MLHHRRLFGSLVLVGGIAVAAAWAAPAPPAPPSITATLAKEINFAGMEDPKQDLAGALEQFSKVYGLVFDINEKAFAAENMKDVAKTEIANPTPVPPMKARLETVLRKVLSRVPAPSGAAFVVRDDHIEITTGATLASEVWGDFKGPHLPLVMASLDKQPLDEALRQLADQTHFNVVLDNRAAEKGVTPVTAKFRNTPLDTAVRLLADMADLRSVQLDNVLYVTTKENAAAMEARFDKERSVSPMSDEELPSRRHRKGTGPNPIVPGGAAPAGAGM